jgi:hypothetical protein
VAISLDQKARKLSVFNADLDEKIVPCVLESHDPQIDVAAVLPEIANVVILVILAIHPGAKLAAHFLELCSSNSALEIWIPLTSEQRVIIFVEGQQKHLDDFARQWLILAFRRQNADGANNESTNHEVPGSHHRPNETEVSYRHRGRALLEVKMF